MREALHTDPARVTHILYAAVSASGGETQIRQRRFCAPVVRYIGACTVSVLLAKTDGTIVYAGTQALVGELTYLIKDGQLGKMKQVKLTT